jgi:hypothetical protein
MMQRNTVARAANELSLAVWFGGSLMGAAGLERGAAVADEKQFEVESRAWSAWRPVQTAAIVTQLASGAALTLANRRRVLGQRGVATASVVRTGLLGAAIALTMAAARSGSTVAHRNRDADADTNGDRGAPEPDVRRLRLLQWSVPALTGALVVMDAFMGEQQRPNQVTLGAIGRLLPDALLPEAIRAA